jgi:hypothetical protein
VSFVRTAVQGVLDLACEGLDFFWNDFEEVCQAVKRSLVLCYIMLCCLFDVFVEWVSLGMSG